MAIMTDGIALTIVVLYYIIYTSKVINNLLITLQNKNSSEEYEMKSKLMTKIYMTNVIQTLTNMI